MPDPEAIIRPAAAGESDNVAAIARVSRQHFLPFLPDLHTVEEDRWFYRERVFTTCSVCVAEADGQLAGFCAYRDGWIDHLYFLPAHVGRGSGSRLVQQAQKGQDALQLWCFQRNTRAIGFYEHLGFRKVRETDGADNEEQVPDALFRWQRS